MKKKGILGFYSHHQSEIWCQLDWGEQMRWAAWFSRLNCVCDYLRHERRGGVHEQYHLDEHCCAVGCVFLERKYHISNPVCPETESGRFLPLNNLRHPFCPKLNPYDLSMRRERGR